MLRYILIALLIVLLARAFWRVVDGVLAGLGARPAGRTPQRGVAMVRDPVCGTFLLPERAITVMDGSRRLFFCSTSCRDKYRAGAT